MKRAGFRTDPLTAAKNFMACSQCHGEQVEDFASRLRDRHLPNKEDANSGVLLQHFLTGLLPSQLLILIH